ncbi:MAG: ribD [Chlamydiales bacterium]|nr:ribD [Chlamydiales bacterium]
MDLQAQIDEQFMHHAIALGEKGRYTAPPNPWVGAVITQFNQIIGEGYHHAPGQPHAEVNAIQSAKANLQGSTIYVTLEPCCHYGRTPPCVQSIIKAGIQRVVVGIEDPDPRVKGQGIAYLKQAGIQVSVGIAAETVKKSLGPYLYHRSTGKPYCVLKVASSIDGRIAAVDKSSKWITDDASRNDVHILRKQSQGILTGSKTAALDLPLLTVRSIPLENGQSSPLRIVLDTFGTLAAKGPLFDTSLAPTLIFTTDYCSRRRKEAWLKAGVEVEELMIHKHKEQIKIDLNAALASLGKRGILQLLVEGGAKIQGAFIRQNLVNKLVVYIGSVILGDQGYPSFIGQDIQNISEAKKWRLDSFERFDNDIRLEYLPIV